jgi:hypothetical protein
MGNPYKKKSFTMRTCEKPGATRDSPSGAKNDDDDDDDAVRLCRVFRESARRRFELLQ